jgi:hypothetical protein
VVLLDRPIIGGILGGFVYRRLGEENTSHQAKNTSLAIEIV